MASGQLWQVLRHIRRLVGAAAVEEDSDGRLLQRFVAEGDEPAFAALVERHSALVWSVCRRVLAHDQDAEDAYQATFLVLARKAAVIRKQPSVGSWLYGTAYRLAMKVRVSAARRRTREGRVAQGEGEAVEPGPSALERQELRAVLDEELSRLPEKYRAPLILCYLEGKTNEEAARVLGWTKGSVSGQLARARDVLRNRLARRGLALAAAAVATLLAEELALAAPPAALAETTIKAATLFAAGGAAAAGGVPERAAALAEGAIRTMTMTKFKLALAVVLTVGLLGGGAGLVHFRSQALGVPTTEPKTELQPDDRGKTEPLGVPLELRLTARKDTYTLDLGGKTPEQFAEMLAEARKKYELHLVPTPPKIDVGLELRNTGKEDVTFLIGGNLNDFVHRPLLEGPGAESLETRCAYTKRAPIPPQRVTLRPGATHAIAMPHLRSGDEADSQNTYWSAYWTRAGTYSLRVALNLAVTPAPKDAKDAGDGLGRVTVTSNAVALKVVDPKPEEKARTEPPGVPLEARLVAKKDTYTLDLGGKTPEEFRKALKNEPFPPAPAVDLALEIVNTSDKEQTIGVGGDPVRIDLVLKGPGAVRIHAVQEVTKNYVAIRTTKLAPGKSLSLPISSLTYGFRGVEFIAYWTEVGDYTLSATLSTQVISGGDGAADKEVRVKVISAPITLKVVEGK